MADFLSEAWFLAVNEKLASRFERGNSAPQKPVGSRPGGRTISTPAAKAPFVVAIELSVDPGSQTKVPNPSPIVWHLCIDEHGARVAPGIPEGPTPTLTIFTDAHTGSELTAGTTNAQRAIDSGHLRVRGDLNALATMTSVFAQLSTIPSAPADL